MGTLFSRIKETIQKLKPTLATPLQPIQEPAVIEEEAPEPAIPQAYINQAGIMHIIRQSARHRLLVQVYYNNVWRYVEPYSFRAGKSGSLFYGHDLIRNGTRSYALGKIAEVKPTTIPFNPRWFIEIE
jgi:predicted DNA-binding transcriptional regulator YafY